MIKPTDFLKQFNRLVFSLLLVGARQSEPEWHRPAKKHRFYSLWLITRGKGTIRYNEHTHTVSAGSLIALVPDAVTEIWSDGQEPLSYSYVRYQCSYSLYHEKTGWSLEPVVPGDFLLQGVFHVQNPPEVVNLFEQMHHLWQRRGQMVIARRRLLFQELVLAIVQDFVSQKVTGDTTLAIERTIDYMVSHYRKPLTLEDLAQVAGLSVSHYARLFKKYAGHSPIDYLTHLRMDRAKELLALSDYRLKGVANSVGYQDEFYFSRMFKKINGLSPSAFAQMHKMKKL